MLLLFPLPAQVAYFMILVPPGLSSFFHGPGLLPLHYKTNIFNPQLHNLLLKILATAQIINRWGFFNQKREKLEKNHFRPPLFIPFFPNISHQEKDPEHSLGGGLKPLSLDHGSWEEKRKFPNPSLLREEAQLCTAFPIGNPEERKLFYSSLPGVIGCLMSVSGVCRMHNS